MLPFGRQEVHKGRHGQPTLLLIHFQFARGVVPNQVRPSAVGHDDLRVQGLLPCLGGLIQVGYLGHPLDQSVEDCLDQQHPQWLSRGAAALRGFRLLGSGAQQSGLNPRFAW